MRDHIDLENVKIDPPLEMALGVRDIPIEGVKKIASNPAQKHKLESFVNATRWGATGWLEDNRRLVMEFLDLADGIRLVTTVWEGLPQWEI